MNYSDVKLPSNRKFGFFFCALFAALGVYFFWGNKFEASYSFFSISLLFLAVTLVKADILLPLNKLWMRIGLLMGMVVSPVILAIIFFGIFTPVSIMMRIFGRDELRLKISPKNSHWIQKVDTTPRSEAFKYQF